MDEQIICRKCGKPLQNKKMIFEYIGNSISYELPTCPQCGMVYVPKELAEGKIAETEMLLEDK